MRIVRRLAVLCTLAIAPVLLAQTLPLNPTVRVLPKPASVVPPDCEEGLAPAKPLPPVEEAPVAESAPAASTAAPPSSDLRTRLRRVQSAAEAGDYNAFKSALADARTEVSAYPAGGEKQAATDVLQVYSDVERLWDYAETNRTGAFFTAANDDLMNVLRKYPNFPRAVADATMTISGQTVYPSTETRKLLVDEAARRLSRLGVRTQGRVVQETPRATAVPPARHAASGERRAAASKTTKPATTKPATKKRPVKIAEAAPKHEPVKRHEEPAPKSAPKPAPKTEPAPAPVMPAPVPQPPPVTTATAAPAPVPVPVPAPATTTTAPSPTTTTASTSEAPPTTATTASTATTSATESTPGATTSSAAQKPPASAQSGGMNLTFAIILIVVGIGVLIVLFRASD